MLNTITGENCIQSVFPQCKLQQSEVTNKTIPDTKQYQNYKINGKQSKMNLTHMMLHIDQSFKCEHSSSNLNFIISFWYRKINVAVFVAIEQFKFSRMFC